MWCVGRRLHDQSVGQPDFVRTFALGPPREAESWLDPVDKIDAVSELLRFEVVRHGLHIDRGYELRTVCVFRLNRHLTQALASGRRCEVHAGTDPDRLDP